jgi:hypothetical protein
MGLRAHSRHSMQKKHSAPGTFTGTVLNRENIGKTAGDLITLWNDAHPDDPVS